MEKMDARPWTLKDCKDRSARPAKFSPEDLILTDEEIATSTMTPSEPPAKPTSHSSISALEEDESCGRTRTRYEVGAEHKERVIPGLNVQTTL